MPETVPDSLDQQVHEGHGGMLMSWLVLSVVFALIARPGRKAVP